MNNLFIVIMIISFIISIIGLILILRNEKKTINEEFEKRMPECVNNRGLKE